MKHEGKLSVHGATTPGLDWKDPDAVRAWLRDMEAHLKDLVEVAEDQTDAPGDRLHGRKGARRLIVEAGGALRQRLEYAARGLGTGDEREGGRAP